MFLTLMLSISALASVQEGASATEQAWWDVGLIAHVVSSAEIEERSCFGSNLGWYQPIRWPSVFGPEAMGGSEGPTFQVEERAGELVVEARYTKEKLGLVAEVVLRLTPAGARARVFRGDDVFLSDENGSLWLPVTEAAGVVALCTDGARVAVDFEVYISEHLDAPSGLFGRVFLGTSGAELAKELIARPISAEASPFESARNVALAEGMQSRGWIDAFGRRQGVWTVRDENGCKRIESAWSDGRPNGRFADWDASGWLRRETSHRDGVEHGEHTTWYENGEIESIENVVDGARHGLRVEFDPSGAKTKEYFQRSEVDSQPEFLRELARLRTRT